ncbi:hypothetical protein PSYJA_45001, partial [Pseudomonas syringae pv. japonica str. M301072]
YMMLTTYDRNKPAPLGGPFKSVNLIPEEALWQCGLLWK